MIGTVVSCSRRLPRIQATHLIHVNVVPSSYNPSESMSTVYIANSGKMITDKTILIMATYLKDAVWHKQTAISNAIFYRCLHMRSLLIQINRQQTLSKTDDCIQKSKR
jgi:hypothetical protein